MSFTQSHIESLSQMAASGRPFAVVTMVDSKGSAPQDPGTKMIVDQNGLVHGTVGGGKVENEAIEFAKRMIANPEQSREIVDWNLQRDIGMTCGGVVKLFFEVFNRDDWNIVIFGAGHVAQALVTVLLTLNCRVTCIDSRAEWIARMPDHDRLTKICSDDLIGEATKIISSDFVLCMTMGHATDRPVMATMFRNGIRPAFLGVIGSKSKRSVLVRELKSEGIDDEVANSFTCPVGLPIGSNQPTEIAISIAAQLLQRRDEVKAKHARS